MKLNLKPGEIKRYRKKHGLLSSRVWKNPVSTLGLDIAFLVVTSISLQAAAMIAIEMAFIHFGTVIAAIALCRVIPRWSRPLVYPAVSTLIMLGAGTLLSDIFPLVSEIIGMYVYLMAVNSMTFAAAMSVERDDKIYRVMGRAFTCVAGFAITMFALSLLREYFGWGAVWGNAAPHLISMAGLLSPFFGFILLGFLLAGVRTVSKVAAGAAIKEQASRAAAYRQMSVDG